MGRVEKYELDLGWDANLMCYIPYGKSGEAKADRDITEAIIEAIKGEIESEYHKPTLIMGDFNAIPGSLQAVRSSLDEEQWISIDANAAWRGAENSMPTCQTRPTAKPTRIDGILANKTALPWISGFQVIKDERIPTHVVLQFNLDRENLNESRRYEKSLPSLTNLVDQQVAENTKDKQGKDKANIEEAQAQQLKDQIDKNLREANRGLRIYQKANATSGFWRTWSKAVERGIL